MTVFLPPPDTNPYLRLLAASLAQCQVTVRTMPVVLSEQWLATVQPSGSTVLHFHWPSYAYLDTDRKLMAEYVRSWVQALGVAKALGFKIVWTAHNLYAHDGTHRDLEREAQQALLDACDSVIVHCRAAEPLLRAHFRVSAPCSLIPHGHYCGVYGQPVETKQARRTLGVPEDGTLYLFFGQLRPYKGLERLLRVFGSLPETIGTLLIAGAVLDAAFARRLLSGCRRQDNIFIHPFFVPDREVSLYLGAADLLVLPYSDVLTSGATALAHSMGRPVIAPALGCLPEMVPGGTGWLYQPDSEEALANALETAQGPLSSETADRCLRFALQKDWRAVAEKTMAAYRS